MYRVHYQEQNDKMSEQVRLWMLESVSTEVEEQTLTMEERGEHLEKEMCRTCSRYCSTVALEVLEISNTSFDFIGKFKEA